ncbi:MAG: hypothetical protein ABI790_12325 [Betaproteobacteria bacterium]
MGSTTGTELGVRTICASDTDELGMGNKVALLDVKRYGSLTPPPDMVKVKGTPE